MHLNCLFRYGRKTATLIMTSGLIVTSCATALSPSYEVYTVLRVLVGAFNIATFIAVNTYSEFEHSLHITNSNFNSKTMNGSKDKILSAFI